MITRDFIFITFFNEMSNRRGITFLKYKSLGLQANSVIIIIDGLYESVIQHRTQIY